MRWLIISLVLLTFLEMVQKSWSESKLTIQYLLKAFDETATWAIEEAQKIKDERRDYALRDIAEALAKAGQFDRAIKTAQKIKDDLQHIYALTRIAKALVEARQVKEAIKVFDQAIKIAQRIKDAKKRNYGFENIAEALAEACQFDRAIQIAQRVKDEIWRGHAFVEISKALAKAGQFEKAIKTAQKIEVKWARQDAFCGIVEVMLEVMSKVSQPKKSLVEEALKITQKIEDNWRRIGFLQDIAKLLAKIGQIDKAKKVLSQAVEIAQKAEYPMVGILKTMAEIGQFDQAIQIVQKVREGYRDTAFENIAEALAEAGQFDRAIQLTKKIKHPVIRAYALVSIVKALLKEKQTEKAIKILDEALKIALKEKGDAWYVLRDIALALAKVGQIERAREIFDKAIERANESAMFVMDPNLIYKGIILALIEAGFIDKAFEVGQKYDGLTLVAEALAKERQFDRAFQISLKIKNAVTRLQALANLIFEMRKAGLIKSAK